MKTGANRRSSDFGTQVQKLSLIILHLLAVKHFEKKQNKNSQEDHLMNAAKSMGGRGRDVKLGKGRNEGVKATVSGLGESAREAMKKMTP